MRCGQTGRNWDEYPPGLHLGSLPLYSFIHTFNYSFIQDLLAQPRSLRHCRDEAAAQSPCPPGVCILIEADRWQMRQNFLNVQCSRRQKERALGRDREVKREPWSLGAGVGEWEDPQGRDLWSWSDWTGAAGWSSEHEVGDHWKHRVISCFWGKEGGSWGGSQFSGCVHWDQLSSSK